jgi:NADPH:quinone reductase-like Zn-dependent oxidoreductase
MFSMVCHLLNKQLVYDCLLQINPVTVVGLLEVAAVQPGQHLLITAAGSTLGRMLIRAARAEGIKTIGVVRRPEAVQELKESTG